MTTFVRFICAALIAVTCLFNSNPAFAGDDESPWDPVTENRDFAEDVRLELGAEIAKLREEIGGLEDHEHDIRKICAAKKPEDRPEVCSWDLVPIKEHINAVDILAQQNSANIVLINTEITSIWKEIKAAKKDRAALWAWIKGVCKEGSTLPRYDHVCESDLVGIRADVKVLKRRGLWLAAGIGYRGGVLPGSGWTSDPVGMLHLSYETGRMGGGTYGFLVDDLVIDTLGGGGGLELYGFFGDNQMVALGIFAGGSMVQHGIAQTGASMQDLAMAEFGPQLVFSPRGDNLKGLFTVRGGLQVGHHILSPALSGVINGRSYGAVSGFLQITVGGGVKIVD